jgi:hypothetical protein
LLLIKLFPVSLLKLAPSQGRDQTIREA